MPERARIGVRCTCERCGQELEFIGGKKRWWDRGAGTKCGPYKGRDGEIVQEQYTKRHKPSWYTKP